MRNKISVVFGGGCVYILYNRSGEKLRDKSIPKPAFFSLSFSLHNLLSFHLSISVFFLL
ncbi:hypothetical protein QBC43DRAFT_308662 [Cladorrhinum sp. PSN259]|nr:hypothetical protein QBC43DRAFT_308662 [Cladorrhinum sp. PSN259]